MSFLFSFLFLTKNTSDSSSIIPHPSLPPCFPPVPSSCSLGSFIYFFIFYVSTFISPLHSRQPFLDHQVFIYVNNCRPAPCGGQPAVTSMHLPPHHSPTSPTPGKPLTPPSPAPGLSAQPGKRGPSRLAAPPVAHMRSAGEELQGDRPQDGQGRSWTGTGRCPAPISCC